MPGRKPATPSQTVEQLCRRWQLVLEKRARLSEQAIGNDKVAVAARARLARLDRALVSYAPKSGGGTLERIVDRWCGDLRADALRVAEELVTAVFGSMLGRTRHRVRAVALKEVRRRGRLVLLRPPTERELLNTHRDDLDEVARVVHVARSKITGALRDAKVVTAFKMGGERQAALAFLQLLGFGSRPTLYRKLRSYAVEHNDGIVLVRANRHGPRAKQSRARPSLKTTIT